jgi:hypothetical protein
MPRPTTATIAPRPSNPCCRVIDPNPEEDVVAEEDIVAELEMADVEVVVAIAVDP